MPGFPLDNSDAKTAGGRFSASTTLCQRTTLLPYISFAYKLSTSETNAAQSQLPKWAGMDLFEIEARAEGNPTKDQMRLMMQALLADRFRLAVHFESREGNVLALTLVKPARQERSFSRMPMVRPVLLHSKCLRLRRFRRLLRTMRPRMTCSPLCAGPL